MRFVAAGILATFALVIALQGSNQAGEKAKHTIKEVMKEAHAKGKIMQAVAAGKADDAQKKQLVELYTALSQNKPPKGDEGDWKTRTGEMLAAAKKAAAGDEKAAKSLGKLANCKACHDLHK